MIRFAFFFSIRVSSSFWSASTLWNDVSLLLVWTNVKSSAIEVVSSVRFSAESSCLRLVSTVEFTMVTMLFTISLVKAGGVGLVFWTCIASSKQHGHFHPLFSRVVIGLFVNPSRPQHLRCHKSAWVSFLCCISWCRWAGEDHPNGAPRWMAAKLVTTESPKTEGLTWGIDSTRDAGSQTPLIQFHHTYNIINSFTHSL